MLLIKYSLVTSLVKLNFICDATACFRAVRIRSVRFAGCANVGFTNGKMRENRLIFVFRNFIIVVRFWFRC